jgi:hypothetical protein
MAKFPLSRHRQILEEYEREGGMVMGNDLNRVTDWVNAMSRSMVRSTR